MRPQFPCAPWALEQSTGRKQKAQTELKESPFAKGNGTQFFGEEDKSIF